MFSSLLDIKVLSDPASFALFRYIYYCRAVSFFIVFVSLIYSHCLVFCFIFLFSLLLVLRNVCLLLFVLCKFLFLFPQGFFIYSCMWYNAVVLFLSFLLSNMLPLNVHTGPKAVPCHCSFCLFRESHFLSSESFVSITHF